MSISRRIFFIGLGAVAVFCCFVVVTTVWEKAPLSSLLDKVFYFITSSFSLACLLLIALGIGSIYLSVVGGALLMVISCFNFLFAALKNYKNKVLYHKKHYEFDDEYYNEMDKFLKLPVREIKNEIIRSPEEIIIIEDKLADIPCEVFLLDMWHEAKIIRGIKLLTGGMDRESSKIYLVEFGQSPPVRQWLSAQLIRQQSEERQQPRD